MIGSVIIPVAAGLLFGVALLLLLALLQRRRSSDLGEVEYSDADGTAAPLHAPRLPLSGKPDYVFRNRKGERVPVEYKSYRSGDHLPHADLIQLGAYLVMLEDMHGVPPPYGVLRYNNRSYKIPYTSELRAEVLALLSALQGEKGAMARATPDPALCTACAFASICDAARVRR